MFENYQLIYMKKIVDKKNHEKFSGMNVSTENAKKPQCRNIWAAQLFYLTITLCLPVSSADNLCKQFGPKVGGA